METRCTFRARLSCLTGRPLLGVPAAVCRHLLDQPHLLFDQETIMTLRRFLPAFSSLALLAALPASGAEPVTVSLDWTPNTNHAGLYVAQALGFYDEAGIEVDILPYPNEGPEADFQFRSVLSLFTLRTGGADIVGVFAVNQREI